MENETIFYILGGTLTALALVISFVGLRSERFPPSGRVLGAVIALFAALVAGTATFAVAGARDGQAEREAEAREQAEETTAAEAPSVGEEGGQPAAQEGAQPAGEAAKGPGATLDLAADPTALAFDKSSLTAEPGKVTILFENPAVIPHNVAVEKGSEILAQSPTITQGKTKVSTELAAGEYTYLCTVPGHAAAGMQGTFSVK